MISLVPCVYCVVEAIQTPDSKVRHLPKLARILLICVFPFVGSIAWLIAGRPMATNPDDDEDFLRKLRERAEE